MQQGQDSCQIYINYDFIPSKVIFYLVKFSRTIFVSACILWILDLLENNFSKMRKYTIKSFCYNLQINHVINFSKEIS